MLTNGNILRLYVCLVFLYLHTSFARGYLLEYDKAIIEDAQLKTHELIRKYGLKAEVHKVYTKDGFVLTAHRIPRPGGQPVLLLHGLEDSSATWVMMGPEQGLGYLLFERGYDVWMLNSRGNTYSRKHLRLHPFMSQFWDFSFHEVGIYDLTASIDYVLGKTNFKKLHYIGHSQGTTSFLALGSDRPAYMKKIKAMHALAPPAFFDNLGSPIAKALAPYARSIYTLLKIIGIHEIPVESEVWRRLIYQICSFAFRNTCTFLFFFVNGGNEAQLNVTMTPIIAAHAPAGSSAKSIAHYAQLYHSGGFYKYNYDTPGENRRRHGTFKAPEYNLTNVDCKMALYYAKNDLVVAVKDVQRLRSILPNVVHDELIAYEKFSHVDFVWAIDARSLLYESLLDVMQRVDNGEL